MSLRIVSDNAADRATLTASTTAGLLAVANLYSDKKSQVHRATATSVTYTLTWTVAETISFFGLPYCNLGPADTLRVRVYAANGTTVLYDSGVRLACAAPARRPRGWWTAAQAASAYAYGGGNSAWHWFAPVGAFKLVADIVSANNPQGYVEAAARIIAAQYWETTYGVSAAPLTVQDTTEIYDNAAGDQMADAGTVRREVSVDLSLMPEADRAACVNLLMDSRAYPILISVFAGADPALERDYMVYGRRPEDSDVSIQFAGAYGSKVTVREI